MFRALTLAVLVVLGACGPVKKTAELDVYLEQFQAVKTEGSDIYLRVSAIAEEKGGQKKDERRRAFEARLQALRLIDQYNRVLTGLARGEDPKSLKSGMKEVGGKLSSYHPSAQTTFAFASAVPYLGTLVSGAGYVQEALAKRNFLKAVREAQKPIGAILDILVLDSEPLEKILVEQERKDQDASRAAVDSLSSRFYKKLQTLKATDEVVALLAAHNAARKTAGFGPVPYRPTGGAALSRPADAEYLSTLTEEAALHLQGYKRAEARIAAERGLFARYRAALSAAKRALAALNEDSEPERTAATGEFNEQALGVRQEALKLKEAR